MDKIWSEINKTNQDIKWKNEIWEDAKEDIAQQAIGREIENRLKETNIDMTEKEIEKISFDMVTKYVELAYQKRGLDQKDRELDVREKEALIKDFEASVQAENPNIWNVLGGGAKKSVDFIDDVLSFENPDRRYYDTPERNRYRGNEKYPSRRERRQAINK